MQFTSSTLCSALSNRVMIEGLGCSFGFRRSFWEGRRIANSHGICIISEYSDFYCVFIEALKFPAVLEARFRDAGASLKLGLGIFQ